MMDLGANCLSLCFCKFRNKLCLFLFISTWSFFSYEQIEVIFLNFEQGKSHMEGMSRGPNGAPLLAVIALQVVQNLPHVLI